jgi:hypothetical protein
MIGASTMIGDYDDVLTNPDFPPYSSWSWTLGMEHDPEEPKSALLPARVDGPPSSVEGSTAVGQFDSASAAATAADALAAICVADTVILPGQPDPASPGREKLASVIDQLKAAGAREAFITDADTGYMHAFDIRAQCDSRDLALTIGRQMAPIVWAPWFRGLIRPWAPGRKLSENHVRARMYVASLWRRSDRPPRDELESKIWELWRAWQGDQQRAVSEHFAGAAVDDELTAALKKYPAVLHSLLGEEPEEPGMPWYVHWDILVDGNDVCLSSVWCVHFATGFPALVGWLNTSGVRSAKYSLYNLMRP